MARDSSRPGRGSCEIASCIWNFFLHDANATNAKRLVVFSENCSGQNKNVNIIALWQYMVALGKFQEVIHIFPVSGHTMMACDRDFGDIKRKLRKTRCIYMPSEYVELVKQSRIKSFN